MQLYWQGCQSRISTNIQPYFWASLLKKLQLSCFSKTLCWNSIHEWNHFSLQFSSFSGAFQGTRNLESHKKTLVMKLYWSWKMLFFLAIENGTKMMMVLVCALCLTWLNYFFHIYASSMQFGTTKRLSRLRARAGFSWPCVVEEGKKKKVVAANKIKMTFSGGCNAHYLSAICELMGLLLSSSTL